MAEPGAAKRDVLSIADVQDAIPSILLRARNLKEARRAGRFAKSRPDRSVALIFEKPSTRTRTSFEVGIGDLGGRALYLSPKELQLGRGETIADTARVLSRYVDAVVYRAFRHDFVVELARSASIPVINGLDDLEHPCQALADLLTLHEKWDGAFRGKTLAYVGDGNNVFNSLVQAAAIVGLNVVGAIPEAYRPPADLLARAEAFGAGSGSTISIVADPKVAAKDADVLYTDVWVSMGDEAKQAEREKAFADYRIDSNLVRLARPSAWVMHDLPAHRGLEITDEVMDGPRSAIWDQAENRLHAQSALLEWVLPRRGGDPA